MVMLCESYKKTLYFPGKDERNGSGHWKGQQLRHGGHGYKHRYLTWNTGFGNKQTFTAKYEQEKVPWCLEILLPRKILLS